MKNHVMPVVVLVSICLVASFLLATTFQLTDPIIKENEIKAASLARKELLPSAQSFEQVENPQGIEGLIDVYKADAGKGYVIMTKAKGYGGDVEIMTSLDAAGGIIMIKVINAGETPGLGTKALVPEYLAGYEGKTSSSYQSVAAIGGATKSSNAVKKAVGAALEAYEAIK